MVPPFTDARPQWIVVVAGNRVDPEYIVTVECGFYLADSERNSVLYVIVTARIRCDLIAEQSSQRRQYYLFGRPNPRLAHDVLQLAVDSKQVGQIASCIG